MAISTKTIKAKIKSVANIKKITKAMEMVAASKMKKTIEKALGTRPFTALSLELLDGISAHLTITHPLMRNREDGYNLCVLMGSNKGLCGGFNSSIAKIFSSYIKDKDKSKIKVITIGRKSEIIARRHNIKPLASFIDLPDKPTERDLRPVARLIQEEFMTGEFKNVRIIYNGFVSSLLYKTINRIVLPIKRDVIQKSIEELGAIDKNKPFRKSSFSQYLFEPGEEEVVNEVLPRLFEMIIYQAFLESLASEHSARMIAMKNASDNADKFVEELEIGYNQARQAAITQEIAEIVGGANA